MLKIRNFQQNYRMSWLPVNGLWCDTWHGRKIKTKDRNMIWNVHTWWNIYSTTNLKLLDTWSMLVKPSLFGRKSSKKPKLPKLISFCFRNQLGLEKNKNILFYKSRNICSDNVCTFDLDRRQADKDFVLFCFKDDYDYYLCVLFQNRALACDFNLQNLITVTVLLQQVCMH